MTRNPPAEIDEDAFVVRRTIRISASAENVWRAITEPEHISRWFAHTELDADGVQGRMTFAGDDDAIPFVVVRREPGRSITYRWNNDDARTTPVSDYDAESATEFTFTIEAHPDSTILRVEESGFEATTDPAVNLREHAGGWTSELDKLVALLERSGTGAA